MNLILSNATQVNAGVSNLSFDAQLLTQISAGIGSIDFGNTATLFLEASPGVTLSYANPLFLSNPAFVQPGTPVPEPTTLALLGVGLAALGLARRERGKGRPRRPHGGAGIQP